MTEEEPIEELVARAARANLRVQAACRVEGESGETRPAWERRTLASLPVRYRDSLALQPGEIRTQGGTGTLDTKALQWALTATERTMMLSGNSRIGKSVIAARVMLHRCRKFEAQGFWVGATELALDVREHGLGHTTPMVRKARELRVIVLDDLGREAPHPDVRQLVNDLLERRLSRGLDTIVTTGIGREDIEARYGTGTWERLTEAGHAIVIAPRLVRRAAA